MRKWGEADEEETLRGDSKGREEQSGRCYKWRGSGREDEGRDGGNIALIALDPGDLIICSPPPLPSSHTHKQAFTHYSQ